METESKDKNLLLTMNDESRRLSSFREWPFDDGSNCSARKMAEAGFVHRPTKKEPDAVQCFVCLKELEGWQDTDDPWKEHQSHSNECVFAHLGKRQKDLSVKEILMVFNQRDRCYHRSQMYRLIENLQYDATAIKKTLKKLT